MPRTHMLPIDEEKLRKEIQRRGLTPSEISYKLGRTQTFINHSLSSGKIAKATTVQLESMFNMKYEDYKQEEPKQEPARLEAPEILLGGQMIFSPNQISKKDLWEIIYTATKKAIEDAGKGKEEEKDGTED